MNTKLIEDKINEKTKALLPVHFTGYRYERNYQLGQKYNIPIIEDACQSILGE